MPKRLKFFVEQWVLFMVRRQRWQVRQFEIFESAVTFESNRNVRFEFESNLEAWKVPKCKWQFHYDSILINWLIIVIITSQNASGNEHRIWLADFLRHVLVFRELGVCRNEADSAAGEYWQRDTFWRQIAARS